MSRVQKRKANQSSQDRLDRMGDIRAGMIGAQLQFHQNEIFLLPFIDYLSLYFQPLADGGPLAFLFWHGDKCKFSSFADLYFTSKYHLGKDRLKRPKESLLISKEQNIWLSVHKIKNLEILENKYSSFDSSATYPIKQDDVLEPYREGIEEIKDLLYGTSTVLGEKIERVKDISPLLVKSIKQHRPTYPQIPETREIPELNYETEVLPMFDSFRSVLDDIFEDTQLVRNVQPKRDKPKLGNIYCVTRVVSSGRLRCGWFPYTAGVLLSKKQRKILEEWCSGCKSKVPCATGLTKNIRCADILEYPLGIRSRSVADAVFSSGIIDFAREPNDNLWDRADTTDGKDLARIRVESCIYPPKNAASLYYVPIHVGGIPWLSLFTFTPTDYKDRWLHNYTIYRDVMPRATTLLRELARQEYFSQLGNSAAMDLLGLRKSPRKISEDINERWTTLARIFPFPHVSIDSERPDGSGVIDKISIPGRGEYYITANNNLFWGNPQLRWGSMDNEQCLRYLYKAIQDSLSERQRINFEQRHHMLEEIEHELSNSITNMKSILLYWTGVSDAEKLQELGEQLNKLQKLYEDWRLPERQQGLEDVTVSSILETIKSENSTLQWSIDLHIDNDAIVKTNRRRLTTHLNELVGNAIKATRQEGINKRIIISTSYHDGGQFIKIEISDQGCGLKDDDFEEAKKGPLHKSDRIHRGLNNCIQYVQQIGGKIEKRANGDKGTIMTITLPIAVPGR